MHTTRGYARLTMLALACSLTASCGAVHIEPAVGPPNIVVILADDHATHAISAYGSQINATPHIDRLADEGMLFRNAFVTNSICVPSRATILTGQYGHLTGATTNSGALRNNQVTFPALLQRAGYQTALVGKWHLKSDPRGFDHYEILPGQGDYYNPTFLTPNSRTEYTGYVTDIITDRALNWLENVRSDDQPFVLMYQHKAPHRGWEPGLDHLNTYDEVAISEPETLFDDYAGRASGLQTQTMTIARDLNSQDLKLVPPPTLNADQLAIWNAAYDPKNEAFTSENPTGDALVRWKYQRYIKDYLRTVASIDDNLGRILAYLDETGLADNTIVIYSSDQGFFLGDHGLYDKRWMYEESLRTPLIVRWPGVVEPGSDNDALVQNLDFAQTFLDAAEVAVPPQMQGQSLLPLLHGQTPSDWRDAIYYQYFEYPQPVMVPRHYGIRTKQHKLIHYYEAGEWELFDLDADPFELDSVYEDLGYASVVEGLTTKLDALRVQFQVPTESP